MVDRIQFIIPNLERRSDRWDWCRDQLLLQGVPDENITRFLVFDGLQYVDENNDHRNLRGLQNTLSKHFGELPDCLKDPWDIILTQYAWYASWYAILDVMSKMPENEYGCWLVDDYYLYNMSYNNLLDYVNILLRITKRSWRTLYAIQLGHYTHPESETYRGLAVPECPRFQYGFSTPDDSGIVCSPRGAKWMMNYINYRARTYRKRKLDPVMLIAAINASKNKNGFFGPYPPETPISDGRGGFTRVTSDSKIASSLEYPKITDRQMSKHYLKRR